MDNLTLMKLCHWILPVSPSSLCFFNHQCSSDLRCINQQLPPAPRGSIPKPHPDSADYARLPCELLDEIVFAELSLEAYPIPFGSIGRIDRLYILRDIELAEESGSVVFIRPHGPYSIEVFRRIDVVAWIAAYIGSISKPTYTLYQIPQNPSSSSKFLM